MYHRRGNIDPEHSRFGHRFTFRAVVTISNTDYRLMEALLEKTGTGQVYTHKRTDKRKKVAYTWRLNHHQIKEWLPLILPWLVLKHDQAVLILEALELADQLSPGGGIYSNSLQSRAMRERKLAVAAEVKFLNRKGVM